MPTSAPHKILVPVDFEGLEEAVAEKAAGFASALGTSVTFLHVVEPPASPGGNVRTEDVHTKEELESLARRHLPADASTEVTVADGVPWSVILHEAVSHRVDMIVMGTHGRHGRQGRLLGKNAEQVVMFSPIPVVTVPPRPAPSRDLAKSASGVTGSAHGEEGVLAVTGALAGAFTGSVAGPPGAVVGAVLGAAAGLAAGKVLDDDEARRHAEDEELDETIGVIDGHIGEADPHQPAPRFGAYSSGASGAERPSQNVVPSEGPIPPDGE